jgi:hypothetical protein
MRLIPGTVLLLLLAGTAQAAPIQILPASADGGERPDEAAAAALADQLLGAEAFEVAAPAPEALGLQSPLHAVGLKLSGCDGRPVGAEAMSEGLDRAREAVDELDYASARLLLAGAAGVLSCLSEPVDRDDLYDVYFLSGLMAYYEDDLGAASKAFARAAGVDPARPWNEAFAPDAKGLFLAALQQAISESGPALRLSPDLEGRVLLDGSVLRSDERPPAGQHLLQVTQDGAATSYDLQLDPSDGGQRHLYGPRGLEAAWLGGDEAAAGLLVQALQPLGWERVLFVDAAGGAMRFDARVARFDREAWPELPRGPVARPAVPVVPSSGRSAGPIAGVVLLGGGAAAGGMGFAIHGSSYQRGMGMLGDPASGDPAAYAALQQQNQVGLAIGLVGAGVAAAGAVVTVVSAVRARAEARGPVSAVPWVTAGPGGLAFGLGCSSGLAGDSGAIPRAWET